MLFFIGICVLNFFISFINARSAGQIWCESKALGGWVRFLTWCTAIQSAVGFTSVYMVIAVFVAGYVGYFDADDMALFVNIVYVLIIIPAIGSGLFITISSWVNFARERSFAKFGVASWNTFAQASNMYRAYNAFGPAIKDIAESFSGGGRSRRKNANVIILVIFVLILGALTTTAIIRRYAGTLEVPAEFAGKLKSAGSELGDAC